MVRLVLIIVLVGSMFSSCKVGTERGNRINPESREDKLDFYRGQLVSIESDINFHMKHRNEMGLKNDYQKLEETLKGLSELLEKMEQNTIEEIIKEMHGALENFNKTASYVFLNRSNEIIFAKLRKIKKVIVAQEKTKAKEKTASKEESKSK